MFAGIDGMGRGLERAGIGDAVCANVSEWIGHRLAQLRKSEPERNGG